MTDFYTNVQVHGGKVLYRGVENGASVRRKLDYHPTLFAPSPTPTKHTTIHGEYLGKLKPGNLYETKDFLRNHKDVAGFDIYGNQRFEYSYISDNYPDHIDWDISKIKIANIDIEVGSENGFPEPDVAEEPITAITYKQSDKFIVFACGKFRNDRDDIQYVQCTDEIDLIHKWLDEWSSDYPDVITGWNIKFFDVPYLVNRITKLLGEAVAKRLSPWNTIYSREVNLNSAKKNTTYTLLGISNLDYIDLYQRYAPEGKSQDNYKLDTIGHAELGINKLSYAEYKTLHNLYRDNFQLFIEYNIRDVELIDKLDEKLKLIELVLTISYDAKCNFEDASTQVRMWDVLIYNHLREKNMVIPPQGHNEKHEMYVGAYVKEPITGMHHWIASFDLNSLYPHLIMQYNISPETLIEPNDYTREIREFVSQNRINVETLLKSEVDTTPLREAGVTMTPNCQFFHTNKQGFLAEMMETMYDDRVKYKNMSITGRKELENETDPDKRRLIQNKISRYHNLQLAKKVCLNSAYGALGNQYFRFFDVRQAAAITTSGQLSIRWIENALNSYMNGLNKTENEDYVLASDTDSIYLNLGRLVSNTIAKDGRVDDPTKVIRFMDKVCEDKIQPFINNTYGKLAEYLNCFSQRMEMKREALCDKGLWTGKKRYILRVWNNEGVEYKEPKIKVMGLEMIKSSTPSACRGKMWEAVDIIFNKDEKALISFISEFRGEFRKMGSGDVAFPRSVNGLDKFKGNSNVRWTKGTPIHVRGSLIYNDEIRKHKLNRVYPYIQNGEKIKFLYMVEPNDIQSNIIAFPDELPEEFNLSGYIDFNTQYEKSFVEPLKMITDSIGWKTENVSSLEEFFS